MIDQHIRTALSTFTVGIAGCGGLGSNCAVALARVGIGRLILVDFDTVEASNLNRQYFFLKQIGMPKVDALADNIRQIDPGVALVTCHAKLDSGNIAELFHDCDVVVEAFDKADQKVMLIETMAEKMAGIPLVAGSGMAGWGESNQIRCVSDHNLYICGDQQSEVSAAMPPLAPRVGIVAHMQANTVLEILLKKKSDM